MSTQTDGQDSVLRNEKGRHFYCSCRCNVFQKIINDPKKVGHYQCNCCKSEYETEPVNGQ